MATFLILLSVCTLICSDSILSHFQKVDANSLANVALDPYTGTEKLVYKIGEFDDVKILTDSLFEESIKSCAKQCLSTKFFCSSFVVVAVYGELQCIMSDNNDLFSEVYFPPVSQEHIHRAQIVGAFKCVSHFDTRGLCYSIKDKIDNVKTISKAPTLLREDRFDELLEGYGVWESLNKNTWVNMRTLLTKCLTAPYVSKSTPTNFGKWVNGVESSGPVSKYTHNGEPSRKRTWLDAIPKSNFLTNLDLFIRGINRNVHTIYDPDEGILYLDSSDIQLLITAYNDNDYFWVVSGKRVCYNMIARGFAGQLNNEEISWTIFMDNLVKAAAHFGHTVNNRSVALDYGYRPLWQFISQLTGPWEFHSDNELLLLRDLSKLVSILYDKPQMKYTGLIQNSFPREHVDIMTQSN